MARLSELMMRSLGYSEEEIQERLRKNETREEAEARARAEAVQEQARLHHEAYTARMKSGMVPAKLEQLSRPIMADAVSAIKAEYEAAGHDWNASKRLIWAIAATGYEDHELCEKMKLKASKGLLVLGPVGTGKTSAFEAAKKHSILTAKLVMCKELRNAVVSGGYEAIARYETIPNVVFDELGREGIAMSYGTRIECITDIVASRYMNMKRGMKLKSYFTTNLTLNELTSMYSDHIVDRMLEMCNVFEVQNKQSFRA